MRRYVPPGSEKPAPAGEPYRRVSIAEWRQLWQTDRRQWLQTLRDRPHRFDPAAADRAVAQWWNEVPATPGSVLPLDGVPFLTKDLFDVRGERSTCGSLLFRSEDGPGVSPAQADAWAVSLLRSAGAHHVGRTQMNEFAYGLDGRNAATGDCPHPLDPRRISGGSSSGSAWAVSAGVVPIALGTDTGGSIRLPASLCGIYGYRMAHAPRRLAGVFPLASRMDTVGWFAATAEDMERSLEVLVATDPPQAGSSSFVSASHGSDLSILVLDIPEVRLDLEVAKRFEELLGVLSEHPAVHLQRSRAPDVLGDAAWKAYNVIGSAQAWEVHQPWLDQYHELYDPVVWALIDRGRHWTTERLREADAVFQKVRDLASALLGQHDLILIPTTPIASPRMEEADGTFREQVLRLNVLGSLGGLSALSLPISHDAVRSSGVQLLAKDDGNTVYRRFLRLWRDLS